MGTIGKITADSATHLLASTAYATCSTVAETSAKIATIQDGQSFSLFNGETVHVKFTYTNTASLPTLNINGTGAYPIARYGDTAVGTTVSTSWQAGAVITVTFDSESFNGGCWQMNDFSESGNSTTYSLSGEVDSHTFTTTLTPSSGASTTSELQLSAGTNITLTDTANGIQIGASHSHGGIQNDGAFLQNSTTTANFEASDRLLFMDASSSNMIKASNITFGTGTDTYLRNDGTWATPSGGGGAVTGVKGDSESSYRTGNVNITSANIGAVPTSRTINGFPLSSNVYLDAGDIEYADGIMVDTAISDLYDSAVTDVQINSTSIVSNNVANIPTASSNVFGAVKLDKNSEPPAGYIRITGSDSTYLTPYVETDSMGTVVSTIRSKWLPDATTSDKGAVIVDSAMSDSSNNAVRNSVIKAYADTKQEALISGTNIKTINNESILGSGNISVGGGSGTEEVFVATYNTTSYNDVLTAYNAGKFIYCVYGSYTVPLSQYSSSTNQFYFYYFRNGSAGGYYLTSSGWSSGSLNFVTTDTLAKYNVKGLVQPWRNHTSASTGPTAGSDATSVTVNEITTTAGKYYAVETDSVGRMFVNVPWNSSGTPYTPILRINNTDYEIQRWEYATVSGKTGINFVYLDGANEDTIFVPITPPTLSMSIDSTDTKKLNISYL